METIKGSVNIRGGWRDEWIEHRGCYGSENTLYDIVLTDICHYTFVQFNRKNNIKYEP